MRQNNHIIKKVALKLDLAQNLDVAEIRSELMNTFQSKIKNELIPLMNEVCGENEVVRIEQLNIDLGEISIDELHSGISAKIIEQLEFQKAKIQTYKFKQGVTKSAAAKTGKDPATIDGISIFKNKEDLEGGFKTTASNRKLDGLIEYLETGVKAWWNPLKNSADLKAYLQELSSSKNSIIDGSLTKKIKDSVGQNENALIRFITLLSQDSLDVWIKTWFPNSPILTKRKHWEPLLGISKLLVGFNEKEVARLISITELNLLFRKITFTANKTELIETVVTEYIFVSEQQKQKHLLSKKVRDQLAVLSKKKKYAANSVEGLVLNVLKTKVDVEVQQYKSEVKDDRSASNASTNKENNKDATQSDKEQKNSKRDHDKPKAKNDNLTDKSAKSAGLKAQKLEEEKQESAQKENEKFEDKTDQAIASNAIKDRIEKEEQANVMDRFIAIQKRGQEEERINNERLKAIRKAEAVKNLKEQDNADTPVEADRKNKIEREGSEKTKSLSESEKDRKLKRTEQESVNQEKERQDKAAQITSKEALESESKKQDAKQAADSLNAENAIEERLEEIRTAQLIKSIIQRNEVAEPSLKSAFFNTAGIVIVWPLIVPLFDDRGLLKDRQFIDKAAQYKGLELLNYIVSGDEPLDEYDMVLNKVLCEIPIEATTLFEPSLSVEDKEEVENLLNHLITHWSVLKSTSINGLREGFILREAELNEFEEHWLLKVEQKGIDILMNKIPWGYKTVKLPWMSKLVSVEW